MKINIKKILLSLFLVSLFLIGSKTFGATYNFSQNLTIGSSGDDVVALQQILVNGGYLTMPAGVAMGNFGNLTKQAVIKYQSANNINPVGNVGPITRAVLKNTDLSNSNTNQEIITNNLSVIPPSIINKPDATVPTITLNVNPKEVASGTSATIDWKAINAVDQCKITAKDSAGKNMSSIIDLFGSKSTGPITKSTIYTIICYNKYGIPGIASTSISVVDPSMLISQQIYTQTSSITGISTSSANRGDIVTITGSKFLNDNDVYFDGSKIDSNLILLQSSTSISFIIPAYQQCILANCLPSPVETKIETGGKKTIQVANTNGFSNNVSFTLPSKIIIIPGTPPIKPYVAPKLAINSITPTSGNRGDIVVLTGVSFASDAIVFFGGFKVPDNLVVSKTNNIISFFVPPFQIGCTDPDYEICPKLPLPGNGLIIETGGVKDVYIMNISTKATSTTIQFTLPSKKIIY